MDRRTFNKFLGVTLIPDIKIEACKNMILPKKLKKGDTVAIITCASSIDDTILDRCVKHMEKLGLNVKLSKNILSQNGYLGGTDKDRIDAIHDAFRDINVSAIWCARGGYGVTRILDKLDYELIKKNPKVFIGYSDITALHAAILHKTGLVTFHGPVGNSELTDYTFEHVKKMLFEDIKGQYIKTCTENPDHDMFAAYILKKGICRGKLVGGNLCLLAALCGTKYQFDFEDKIVFIEDIDERPYKVDRMLTQLHHATNISKAAGIVLGIFRGCKPDIDEKSSTLKETFELCFKNYEMPIAYGFSFGHIDNQCTLPYNIDCEMNTENMSISF